MNVRREAAAVVPSLSLEEAAAAEEDTALIDDDSMVYVERWENDKQRERDCTVCGIWRGWSVVKRCFIPGCFPLIISQCDHHTTPWMHTVLAFPDVPEPARKKGERVCGRHRSMLETFEQRFILAPCKTCHIVWTSAVSLSGRMVLKRPSQVTQVTPSVQKCMRATGHTKLDYYRVWVYRYTSVSLLAVRYTPYQLDVALITISVPI